MQTVGLRPRLRGRRSLVDLMVGSNKGKDQGQEDDSCQHHADTAAWAIPRSPRLAPAREVDSFGDAPPVLDAPEEEHPVAADTAPGTCATEASAEPCSEAAEPVPGQQDTAGHSAPQPETNQSPGHAISSNSGRVLLPAGQCGKTSSKRSLTTTSPVAALSRQDQGAPTSNIQASQATVGTPPPPTSTSKQPAPQREISLGDSTTAPPSSSRTPESRKSRRASNTDRSSKMAPVRACLSPDHRAPPCPLLPLGCTNAHRPRVVALPRPAQRPVGFSRTLLF